MTYEDVGKEIGKLVDEKDAAYGSSHMKSPEFLRLLYPDGVPVDKYQDMLYLVRIFDKQMRIATDNDAFGESPYRDIAGYGILAAASAAEAVPVEVPEPNKDNGLGTVPHCVDPK